MNKQQLENSRENWRGYAIYISIVSFFLVLIIFTSNDYNEGFKDGINQTLTNYICTEKITGSFFMNKTDMDAYNNLQINPNLTSLYDTQFKFGYDEEPRLVLYKNLSCNYQGDYYSDKKLCVNLANFIYQEMRR